MVFLNNGVLLTKSLDTNLELLTLRCVGTTKQTVEIWLVVAAGTWQISDKMVTNTISNFDFAISFSQ